MRKRKSWKEICIKLGKTRSVLLLASLVALAVFIADFVSRLVRDDFNVGLVMQGYTFPHIIKLIALFYLAGLVIAFAVWKGTVKRRGKNYNSSN